MSAIPTSRLALDRAAINRANSQHSTGPRTAPGKQRSSLNAVRHGLTASSPVLPSEDRAAYESHCRAFFDEYYPATPTETQLVLAQRARCAHQGQEVFRAALRLARSDK